LWQKWPLLNKVSTFSSKGKIVLIGDFNSRTGQNPDFIEKDSSQINDYDGVDLLPPDYVTDTELKRVNQDNFNQSLFVTKVASFK
jgi:hypothetical protein